MFPHTLHVCHTYSSLRIASKSELTLLHEEVLVRRHDAALHYKHRLLHLKEVVCAELLPEGVHTATDALLLQVLLQHTHTLVLP